MWRVKLWFGKYNFFHEISKTSCSMQWNEIDFEVQVAEKANGAESTPYGFQTNYFSRVVECGQIVDLASAR